LGDYLWLIAVGVDAVCFLIGFVATLIAFGFQGLPENQEQGGVLLKIGALAFGVVVGFALAAMGVIAVKSRAITDRWGNVTRGPIAVILGMMLSVTGSSFGGFAAYALLMALIRGR
jgi:hypothetical protein